MNKDVCMIMNIMLFQLFLGTVSKFYAFIMTQPNVRIKRTQTA